MQPGAGGFSFSASPVRPAKSSVPRAAASSIHHGNYVTSGCARVLRGSDQYKPLVAGRFLHLCFHEESPWVASPGSQRNSPRAPASRARQGDNAATGRAGIQAGGTRTMTAYPDESLRIQGRATGQGNWQADRAAITNVRLGAQQLLRDTASTLDENSPLRSRLRQLLATIALQLEGNQFFLPRSNTSSNSAASGRTSRITARTTPPPMKSRAGWHTPWRSTTRTSTSPHSCPLRTTWEASARGN